MGIARHLSPWVKPGAIESLLDMRLAGVPYKEISERLGVSRNSACGKLKDLKNTCSSNFHGWPLGKYRSEEYVAAINLDCRFTNGRHLAKYKRPIKIPAWVPPHLRIQYHSIAKERGEFVAASKVRALKAQAKLEQVPA